MAAQPSIRKSHGQQSLAWCRAGPDTPETTQRAHPQPCATAESDVRRLVCLRLGALGGGWKGSEPWRETLGPAVSLTLQVSLLLALGFSSSW